MIKEACRIPFTIILLWTICMTKGASANKDIDIDKDISQNSNEELLYNDDSYDDNILNYGNENYAKKVDIRQCEKKESRHDAANENKEKLENIVSINRHNLIDQNNENQLEQEGGVEKQFIPIHNEYKEIVEKPQPNFDVIKKRRNYLGHFKPGRKSPLSYLHINQVASYKKHPDIYIFNSDSIDENVIRRFTGSQKKYLLPTCDINENQSVHKNDHALNPLSESIKMKREINSYYLKPQFKTSPDHEGLRKVRSQWKVKSHSNGFDTNDIQHNYYKYKNKSPLEYLHINKISDTKNTEDDRRKLPWSDINEVYNKNFQALDNKINHYQDYINCELTEEKEQVYSNNTSSKNTTNANQVTNSSVDEMPKINTEIINPSFKNNIFETKILTNNTNKIQKLCNKATNNSNLFESLNKNFHGSKGTSSINNEVSLSENNVTNSNSAEITKAILNSEFSHQISNHLKELLPKNEDLFSIKNEDIAHILNSHEKNADKNNENSVNTDVQHDTKNKIQVSTSRAQPPPPLFNVTPNVSYIYLQPIPLSNSMYLQKLGYSALSPNVSSENTKENIKVSDSNITHENKSNDLITISIDPKTLQNKILHAEFIKKSDIKKTPDTLSIELTPKDSILEANDSKQKDVSFENPLQIAASVKNNSIFITSDKHSPDRSHIFMSSILTQKPINIVLDSINKKNLREGYKKRFSEEKNLVSSDAGDRQKKAISISSLNVSDSSNEPMKEDNSSIDALKSLTNGENDLTKVVIIQTKEKEFCRTEAACQETTLCSMNIYPTDSPCKRSTIDVNNFKELHEGLRESRDTNYNKINIKENPHYFNNCTTIQVGLCGKIPCPTHCAIKIKREAEKLNISKLINILKPVILLSPKEDTEGSEDDIGDNSGFIDKVNLKGSSGVNFEKGNKKVENKILEGFINSIIANYSKDELKPIVKETTERNDDGAEALFKLLENSMPKKIDKEEIGDKKSDLWNLTPILVPETSISKYGESSEYAKLGPFDENVIKSFLKKDSIPFLQEEKQ